VGRRLIFAILLALGLAALVTAIGVSAYHAGFTNGISGGGHIAGVPGYYRGYGPGFGFFPGFFLFPLILLFIVVAVFWRRPWRHRSWGYGPGGPGAAVSGPFGPRGWASGGPRHMFDEWHRQAHEGQTPPPVAEPTTPVTEPTPPVGEPTPPAGEPTPPAGGGDQTS
jgi:hypothetical protein